MIFTKSDYEYKKYLVAEITGIVTEFHFMQLKKLNTSEIYQSIYRTRGTFPKLGMTEKSVAALTDPIY